MDNKDSDFSMMDVFPPVHKEGQKFILVAVALTLLCWLLLPDWVAWLPIAFGVFCAYFFRNPDRIVPTGEGLLVSPADGRVQLIQKVVPPEELEMGEAPLTRISIFLSVLDVHVNRTPVAGRVDKRVYIPGAFLNASLDKASEKNERMLLRVTTTDEKQVGFVQIAGLVARRILCFVAEGDELERGERFGLIRFGSRMDIYLPEGFVPQVAIGQRTLGGETVIAVESKTAQPVEGVRR
ncbi:MAG: phosphatidylserine decarboxylase [Sphingomonadales bacterium]|jgi:phosphatidylserine decarboxylase